MLDPTYDTYDTDVAAWDSDLWTAFGMLTEILAPPITIDEQIIRDGLFTIHDPPRAYDLIVAFDENGWNLYIRHDGQIIDTKYVPPDIAFDVRYDATLCYLRKYKFLKKEKKKKLQ